MWSFIISRKKCKQLHYYLGATELGIPYGLVAHSSIFVRGKPSNWIHAKRLHIWRSCTLEVIHICRVCFGSVYFAKIKNFLFLSLFGQPHGIGSLRQISWDLGALILLIGALCIVVVVGQWIICYYIVDFWDFMGFLMYSARFSIYLVELVGEAFILHLEPSSAVFDVVYLEGMQLVDVWGFE